MDRGAWWDTVHGVAKLYLTEYPCRVCVFSYGFWITYITVAFWYISKIPIPVMMCIKPTEPESLEWGLGICIFNKFLRYTKYIFNGYTIKFDNPWVRLRDC